MEWEDKYPLAMVDARDRSILDHTQLVLNTGSSTHQNKQTPFKFERGWLIRDGFFDLVAEIGELKTKDIPRSNDGRIKFTPSQYLRGWAKHMAGAYKKEKKRLLKNLDSLDKKRK